MKNKKQNRRTGSSASESKKPSERPDLRSHDTSKDDGLDLDLKDVVCLDDEPDDQQPPTPEDEGRILTLPGIPLQELICSMRRAGFWFNPNLRPDFPDLRGHFTNFLPHLARCRMLVQCNPNKTSDQVHHWMWWPGDGSAQVHAVYHVPIIDDAAFLNPEAETGDRWWRYLRQIVQDAVELKPDQRWLRFYRITVSFDGRHERLLWIVHLGCHALTACAFFLAPNRLIPERITDFRRTK